MGQLFLTFFGDPGPKPATTAGMLVFPLLFHKQPMGRAGLDTNILIQRKEDSIYFFETNFLKPKMYLQK